MQTSLPTRTWWAAWAWSPKTGSLLGALGVPGPGTPPRREDPPTLTEFLEESHAAFLLRKETQKLPREEDTRVLAAPVAALHASH